MPDQLKVAYFLQRFPHLTETFILREMLHLRKLGLDVQIFSLLSPEHSTTMHHQVDEMLPYVHYSPFLFSWQLILAQFYYLLHSPVKYFNAFRRAFQQTRADRLDLLKMVAIFPKSVYFARQLQQLKFVHIHAHFVSMNAISARIAADLSGIPCTVHAHAYDIFQRNQTNVRRQLEMVDGIVTVSEYHRRYLVNLCPRWSAADIRVIHYGLDPTEFTPTLVIPEEGCVRIISVASLVEKKGHQHLIDACALLAARGYAFHCSIVGGGYLSDVLQARITANKVEGQVTLHGPLNQTEVQTLYRQSDIFALACVVARNGDRDGMPNVLLEAMALQLPVVTTPVTGNPELVHDGENGLIVAEGDPKALADALERLICDPILRSELGVRGRQTILQEFDINQTSNQMATFFKQWA